MFRQTVDDAARRVPFLWRGPANQPLWWKARAGSTIAAALMIPLLAVVLWLAQPTFLLRLWGLGGLWLWLARSVVAVVAAVALTVWLIRKISPHVRPVTPLGHLFTVLMAESAAPRPARPVTQNLVIPKELFGGEISHPPPADQTG